MDKVDQPTIPPTDSYDKKDDKNVFLSVVLVDLKEAEFMVVYLGVRNSTASSCNRVDRTCDASLKEK